MLQSTSNIVLDLTDDTKNPVPSQTKLKMVNTTTANYKTTRRTSDCNHCKQTSPRPTLQSVPEIKGIQKRTSISHYQHVQALPSIPPTRPIMLPSTVPISPVDQQQFRVYAPIRRFHPPPPAYLPYRPQYYYVQRYYPRRLYHPYSQYPRR